MGACAARIQAHTHTHHEHRSDIGSGLEHEANIEPSANRYQLGPDETTTDQIIHRNQQQHFYFVGLKRTMECGAGAAKNRTCGNKMTIFSV